MTIILVNFNGGDFILHCLEALNRQTLRDFVTVVVDNASHDGSPQRITAQFPQVQLLALPENQGFAAGVNYGLQAQPLTTWVALLNPDTVPSPCWLERLLATAAARPEFAAFGCRMVQDLDAQRLDGIGDAYHVSGLPWRMGHGALDGPRYQISREIFSPCAAAALYQRAALQQVGGLDAELFCYVEDVDLGFRLRLAGYRAWYVADATLCHWGSGLVGRHSQFQLYHGHRNWVWVYIKNMPSPLFWLFLPLHLGMNLLTLIWFSWHGHGPILFRAKWDALRGLPYWWRKRQAVQATRRITAWQLLTHLTWYPLSRR